MALLLVTVSSPFAGAALYTAPSDWKVEVVAEAPKVKSPTAIAVAPDGRVFVGEDLMDMAGPSDEPINRVLCLSPDGQIKVFAENLWCIFGLQYLDGKLYVNHAPVFSMFTDDEGVGKDRIDLFKYPNARQQLIGSITHIPGNIRWAMDGFLYMAVGDTGLYKAKGRDGQEFTLQGGGIVRFRPDGTGLETFCTGTRNTPDIAVNAEDEMFTYDNTDDGQGWWTRVTHMVDGGFYGYPWDYRPQRPYTLWMMGDYGGGSGTASFAYNEDALPEEYRGNLFLGDYARSQLLRLRVARDGATYKIVSREMRAGLDFLTRGASDLRPLGVAVAPDGAALYVTDWNTHMSLVKAEAGRVLKVSYAGKSLAAPKPAWFAAAGVHKPFQASTEDLLTALRHPAYAVRMIAQRRVAERGAGAIQPLTAVLEDRSQPAHARWSALWALDAIDGGKASRRSIIAQLKDSDPSVRRQACRQLGTRHASEAAGELSVLLKDSEASVRFHAATALGRLGLASTVPALLSALEEKDLFARYAAFQALHRIGGADGNAWTQTVAGLRSPHAAVREGTLFAMREAYSLPLVTALTAYFSDTNQPPEMRLRVLQTLGETARRPAPWNGEWWGATGGSHPVNLPRPLKTLDWDGTPQVVAALRAALRDPRKEMRLAALTGLQRSQDTASIAAVREMLGREADVEMLKAVFLALGELKDPGMPEILHQLYKDPNAVGWLPTALTAAEKVGTPAVVQALIGGLQSAANAAALGPTIQTLANLRAHQAVPALAHLIGHGDPKVGQAAIQALVQIGGDNALEALTQQFGQRNQAIRQTIVSALGSMKTKSVVPALLNACQDKTTRQAAVQALTQIPDVRAVSIYLEGLTNSAPGLPQACYQALSAIANEAVPLIEERLEKQPVQPEILQALQQLGGATKIRDWFLLGQFHDTSLDARLAAEPVPFAANLADASGQRRTWVRVSGKPLSGRVNVREVLRIDPAASNAVAYAAAQLAGGAQPEVELIVNANVPLTVWVNGQKVFTRAIVAQPPYRLPVTLKEGQNGLLARLDQAGEATEFSVRVASQPLNATRSTLLYATYSRNTRGNPNRGRDMFHDLNGMACLRCHRVKGHGSDLGPDLSSIGAKYTRDQLVEGVLYPSKYILPGYQQTIVTTKDGETFSGLVRKEDPDGLTLVDAGGQEHRLRKAQLQERKLSEVSLMPEGLHTAVNEQEFPDLIDYLETLKDGPNPGP